MNKTIKKLMACLMLVSSGLIGRGGHHGGHHSHHGHHGHHGHHSHIGNHGHHGHHPYGYHGYRGYHGGWRAGWGWGYPGWRWGVTPAIIAGTFLFAGYTEAQWRQMAAQDPEKRVIYETQVLPAYRHYQENPSSVPSYNAEGDVTMTDPDVQPMEIETNIDADYIIVRRCCTDAQSNWYGAGPDRQWREENISSTNFSIYRRSDFRPVSFADLSEQPQISGFERSVYTSPK